MFPQEQVIAPHHLSDKPVLMALILRLSILSLVFFMGGNTAFGDPEVKTLRIITVPRFQPLIDHLNSQIPEYHFEIANIPVSEMVTAARNHQFDFVLAAPTHYVMLDVAVGATAIATFRDMVRPGIFSNLIGGVVLCRTDDTSIRQITDLRGKHIAAVDPLALGGWISLGRELYENGIDPETDIQINFERNPDGVLEALRQRKSDAGVVASGIVERFLDAGKIRLGEFRVLPPKEVYPEAVDFPFLHTTRLYPQTAFTALPHVPEPLLRKIALIILRLPEDGTIARLTRSAWSLPFGYQSVHRAMQIMRVTPYQDFGKVTLLSALRQNWEKALSALAALVGMLVVLLFRMAHLNRKLALSRTALQREFELHNISQEKRLESEARFHSIFDNSAVGIYLTDVRGRILESNTAFDHMLSYSKDELRTLDLEFLTCPDDWLQERIYLEELFESRRATYELDKRCLRKGGEIVWVHFTASPVRNVQGEILWGIFIVEEITRRKQAEEERDRLISDLQKALQEVQTLSRLLPICSNCKKIRDDQGYWKQVEEYLWEHNQVQFSHSLCPVCITKIYPEFCSDENDDAEEGKTPGLG